MPAIVFPSGFSSPFYIAIIFLLMLSPLSCVLRPPFCVLCPVSNIIDLCPEQTQQSPVVQMQENLNISIEMYTRMLTLTNHLVCWNISGIFGRFVTFGTVCVPAFVTF